jgi:peptide/nickel transport system substrate-binding protein
MGYGSAFRSPLVSYRANWRGRPVRALSLRGNGANSWDGWPTSARLEELRQAWLDASDLEAEKRVCRELQLQLWQDVPYIPMGEYSQQTCYRRTVTDAPKGPALFFGVRPA